jgi:hypothetical protein
MLDALMLDFPLVYSRRLENFSAMVQVVAHGNEMRCLLAGSEGQLLVHFVLFTFLFSLRIFTSLCSRMVHWKA